MKHHIRKIAEHIKNDNCVFFIGAGISSASGLPSGLELAKKIASELNIKYENQNLSELAEYYEAEFKRLDLIEFLRKNIYDIEKSKKNDKLYKIIAKMPVKLILTTNYDNLLQDLSDEYNVIYKNNELWRLKDNVKNIIKIHGDFKVADEIIITESDFIKYPDSHPNIMSFLEYIFSSKTVVFIGFGLRDLNTNSILYWINKTLKKVKRNVYSVTNSNNEYYKKVLTNRDVTVLNYDAETFLENLANELKIDLNKTTKDLEFTPYYNPKVIKKGELSSINFAFKNNTSKAIHCLSYKFECYYQGEQVTNFQRHTYALDINANDSVDKKFSEKDPIQYYFRKKAGSGELISKIYVEYQKDPLNEEQTENYINVVVGEAVLTVK